MADVRRPKPARRRAGFEPARGFPDPAAKSAETLRVPPGGETHMAHRNGSVCGEQFTDAADYAQPNDEPTCPQCAAYYRAVQKTALRSPSAGTPPAAPST